MWLGGHVASSTMCIGTATLNALQCAGKLLSEASSRSSAHQHSSSGRATPRSAAGSVLVRGPSGRKQPAAPAAAQRQQVSDGDAGTGLKAAPKKAAQEPPGADRTLAVDRGAVLLGSGSEQSAAQPAGAPPKPSRRGERSKPDGAERAPPGGSRDGGGAAAAPVVDQDAVKALQALQQLEAVVAAAAANSSTRRVRPSAKLAVARVHTDVADPSRAHTRKHSLQKANSTGSKHLCCLLTA